jgi:thymidylate synthase (FAD)
MEVRLIDYYHNAESVDVSYYIFNIKASTKVLLEMTRHRDNASYACKSSRYTLNKGEVIFESTGDTLVDELLNQWKLTIEDVISQKKSNDIVSLMLPQAYQYRWQVQFNARSLMNFLELRRHKSAHFHIREVAEEMFKCIPEDMRYLFDKYE